MSNAGRNLSQRYRGATWKTYTVSPHCTLHVQAIKKGTRNVLSVMEINWAHDDVSRGFDVTGYTEVHNWSFRHTVSAVKTLLIDLSEKTLEWIKNLKKTCQEWCNNTRDCPQYDPALISHQVLFSVPHLLQFPVSQSFFNSGFKVSVNLSFTPSLMVTESLFQSGLLKTQINSSVRRLGSRLVPV